MRKAMVMGMAAAAATAACSEARSQPGETDSRSYSASGFDKIEIGGPYDVQVTTGQAESIRATGDSATLERMIVEVKGDTLKIHPRKRRGWNFGWNDKGKVTIAVTVPSLRAAGIAGSGNMQIDKVSGESFDGSVAGSGDLRVAQLAVNRASLEIAGSGEIEAAGRANRVSYEIAGSGDIRASRLAAEDADVSIAGSGNVAGHATGNAKVDIAGSGDVRLTGGAQCRVSKAGSGNVDCS